MGRGYVVGVDVQFVDDQGAEIASGDYPFVPRIGEPVVFRRRNDVLHKYKVVAVFYSLNSVDDPPQASLPPRVVVTLQPFR